MSELLTGPKVVTLAQAARCKLVYDQVMERAEEYADKLDTALEDTADQLDLVRAQLAQVATKVAEAS
jgi:hypothetical protein